MWPLFQSQCSTATGELQECEDPPWITNLGVTYLPEAPEQTNSGDGDRRENVETNKGANQEKSEGEAEKNVFGKCYTQVVNFAPGGGGGSQVYYCKHEWPRKQGIRVVFLD